MSIAIHSSDEIKFIFSPDHGMGRIADFITHWPDLILIFYFHDKDFQITEYPLSFYNAESSALPGSEHGIKEMVLDAHPAIIPHVPSHTCFLLVNSLYHLTEAEIPSEPFARLTCT